MKRLDLFSINIDLERQFKNNTIMQDWLNLILNKWIMKKPPEDSWYFHGPPIWKIINCFYIHENSDRRYSQISDAPESLSYDPICFKHCFDGYHIRIWNEGVASFTKVIDAPVNKFDFNQYVLIDESISEQIDISFTKILLEGKEIENLMIDYNLERSL